MKHINAVCVKRKGFLILKRVVNIDAIVL
jgi:hypothetical protein